MFPAALFLKPISFLVSRLAKNQMIIIFTGFPRGAKENACSDASVAQLVEQLICNQQVMGSSPFAGSSFFGFAGAGCLKVQAARLILGSFHRSLYGVECSAVGDWLGDKTNRGITQAVKGDRL
jgi:hypothetical protein